MKPRGGGGGGGGGSEAEALLPVRKGFTINLCGFSARVTIPFNPQGMLIRDDFFVCITDKLSKFVEIHLNPFLHTFKFTHKKHVWV